MGFRDLGPMRRVAARRLLDAYGAGQATRLEVARQIELWARGGADPALPRHLWETLEDLFPVRGHAPPDRDVIRLLACILRDAAPDVLEPLTALALRRPLLATVSQPGAAVPDDVLRPGERVLLGTERGREALAALLDGRVGPVSTWLRRTVLDPDAFVATTWDVPLAGLASLGRLVDRLADATEALPPGRVRAQVAREWISEISVESLDDRAPFADVVRCVGEHLLRHRAPVLLWHACQQLALVVEDQPLLAKAVLTRCLPITESEAGLSPAAAAAPFLHTLTVRQAAALLDSLAPDLPPASWDVVASTFFAGSFRDRWADWRGHVQRWAHAEDAPRALAALAGFRLAGLPERGALDWFIAAPAPAVRQACRTALLETGAA